MTPSPVRQRIVTNHDPSCLRDRIISLKHSEGDLAGGICRVKVSSVKLSTESAGLKNADPKGNFATIWGPECTDIIADKQGQLHRCGLLVLSARWGTRSRTRVLQMETKSSRRGHHRDECDDVRKRCVSSLIVLGIALPLRNWTTVFHFVCAHYLEISFDNWRYGQSPRQPLDRYCK